MGQFSHSQLSVTRITAEPDPLVLANMHMHQNCCIPRVQNTNFEFCLTDPVNTNTAQLQNSVENCDNNMGCCQSHPSASSVPGHAVTLLPCPQLGFSMHLPHLLSLAACLLGGSFLSCLHHTKPNSDAYSCGSG